MDEEESKSGGKEESAGAPMWVVTFADLATLLMCFFVLILSFSEMDIIKYKQIAGSLSEAFGVQRQIKSKDAPRGVNVIAREFSAGKPEPTPINRIRQNTTNYLKRYLEVEGEVEEKEQEKARREAEAAQIKESLQSEIEQGLIDVETDHTRVIIRIREKGSFPPGGAELRPEFTAVIAKLGEALSELIGLIVVAGHTDNIPLKTSKYRSNWDLSAARAVSVVQVLEEMDVLDGRKFQVVGMSDSEPLAPNTSMNGRAQNRRVELMVVRDLTTDDGGSDKKNSANGEGNPEGFPDPVDQLEQNTLLLQQLQVAQPPQASETQ